MWGPPKEAAAKAEPVVKNVAVKTEPTLKNTPFKTEPCAAQKGHHAT